MTTTDSGRKTGRRPTRAEREQRIGQIHTLLIGNTPRRSILQFVAEKTAWGISERTIDNLIAKANASIQSSAAFDRDQELGTAILQLRDLYHKALRIQDYKTSLAVRRELSELLGLYALKQLTLTDPDGKPAASFVAFFPAAPPDRETWSRQCRAELAQIAHHQQQQPPADTTAGSQPNTRRTP